MVMLKKGVLKHMEKEDLDEVFGQLLSYQDLELFDTAVRYTKSLSDYQFTRELLNRYTKYIEIKDNEKNLWNLSIICEAEGMAERFLKKTKDISIFPGWRRAVIKCSGCSFISAAGIFLMK